MPNQWTKAKAKAKETERDRAKWLYFPNKLIIIRKADIDAIRKGIWTGL
jgi:hypothetical protein